MSSMVARCIIHSTMTYLATVELDDTAQGMFGGSVLLLQQLEQECLQVTVRLGFN